MNFAESEAYLLSLGNEVSAMKLGLDNIRRLLANLGDPQNKYLKVQIAGTNGKGSVCAFLSAICREAGINAGVYTSPHLVSMTERINIGGKDISEERFADIATGVRETAESMLENGELEYRPTFFEQMTAIALSAFAEANVNLAILETGLGGRLDATTAANAEICAITRIDIDHQEYLGETLEEIAAEKAAIIRRGTRVIVGDQDPRAMRVIAEYCDLHETVSATADRVRTTCGSRWLTFATDQAEYQVNQLGLAGDHQIENAKVAILIAEALSARFPLTQQSIEAGLRNASNPGRLEYREGNILLDGAHNVGGARALRRSIEQNENRPITLIFGAMRGKDVGSIAAEIFPLAERIILTQPMNTRAMLPNEISEQAAKYLEGKDVLAAGSVHKALKMARSATAENGLILVTGSLYLVGEVKKLLNNLE